MIKLKFAYFLIVVALEGYIKVLVSSAAWIISEETSSIHVNYTLVTSTAMLLKLREKQAQYIIIKSVSHPLQTSTELCRTKFFEIHGQINV